MKGIWLHRASAAAPLIVFCNGWGMDERAVAHLDGTGCSVLCLYDYRSPELPAGLREEVAAMLELRTEDNAAPRGATTGAGTPRENTATPAACGHTSGAGAAGGNVPHAQRPRHMLVAWSLGVFMSACVRRQLPPFAFTLACNGTPRPLDAACGIPPDSYEHMERTLSPAVRDAFMANAGMPADLCRQNVDELREELTAVRRLAQSGTMPPLPFDVAILSRKDRIFTARNQRRWWQTCPGTRIILQEGAHWPFTGIHSWLELTHV